MALMETWTVTYRKQTWIKRTGPNDGRSGWVTSEEILASGVSKSEADAIMARHPDRLNVTAAPDRRDCDHSAT